MKWAGRPAARLPFPELGKPVLGRHESLRKPTEIYGNLRKPTETYAFSRFLPLWRAGNSPGIFRGRESPRSELRDALGLPVPVLGNAALLADVGVLIARSC